MPEAAVTYEDKAGTGVSGFQTLVLLGSIPQSLDHRPHNETELEPFFQLRTLLFFSMQVCPLVFGASKYLDTELFFPRYAFLLE